MTTRRPLRRGIGAPVYAPGGTLVPVTQGGTGASTAAGARAALGVVVRTELGSMAGELGVTPAPARWYNDTGFTITLTNLRASVGSSPIGAAIIVNCRLAGVDNTALTIADAGYASAVAAGPITVVDGSYVDIEVEQVGSTAPGADLTVSAKAAW